MKRIQRKRTKGYKQPENCKYVGRPGKWGNPVKLVGDMIYIDASHRRKILDPWVYYDIGDINDVFHLYRHIINGSQFKDLQYWADKSGDLQYWSNKFKELDIEELRQYDYLSCFCPLNKPCHVDVLIDKLKENG